MKAKIELNKSQQEAVDHIYGPLLVLAGPGTGKTQLLSARIANILKKTDASAQNILCLTFTENAAQNMRERLSSLILDDAYDVHINTYHGFGSDIIRFYPEFFEDINFETGEDNRLERPLDELQGLQIVSDILNRLPYTSPLLSARHFPKNVLDTIGDLKKSLLTPESLKAIADQNLKQVRTLSPKIANHLKTISRFPSKAAESISLFEPIEELLSNQTGLADIAHEELLEAMGESADTNKSKPLTAWKNKWLKKDEDNNFCFTDEAQHLRMIELSKVYKSYGDELKSRQLYDFNDMILRVIDALKNKTELKYNLQEKYQFILLDEFQDTNAAQFELVKYLADNPVNEGKPNVFAVGDDDQAIYAFQGAKVSNMLSFVDTFEDVKVINLTENYRSHPDILHVAHNIATQIESRLHHQLQGIDKLLVASGKTLPKTATIERHEFNAEANEYTWVAEKVKKLVSNGVHPGEIAVLAPKHKYLERTVPFLVKQKVPVSYEKREDILKTKLIRDTALMCRLVLACHEQDAHQMNHLFPQVLSSEYFGISVKDIWSINWSYRTEGQTWAETALNNENLAPTVMAFLSLGLRAETEPLEYMLDYLIGSTPVVIDSETSYIFPLKSYYFKYTPNTDTALEYYELLTNLSAIREHLRARQVGETELMTIQGFLDFIHAYELAEQPLINTHPIAQDPDSVQLMTTYKAKGLEFEYIFLINLHDDVWGKSAKANSNKLSLPANLTYVRYSGSSEDELKRLLFVAVTRAKHGLFLSSHAIKDNGKATEPVKYLQEFNQDDQRLCSILPESNQHVTFTEFSAQETMQAVETMWNSRHLNLTAELKSLLQPCLNTYQMSPTHLNTFIDTEFGGPEVFLLNTLLRFPQAPGEDGEFGNAIHATLEYLQNKVNKGTKFTTQDALKYYDKQLSSRYIAKDKMDDYRVRGHQALSGYLEANQNMWAKPAKSEVNFRNEGVVVGKARLSGKIDRLEVNPDAKTVDIIDFKTGDPLTKWDSSTKAKKYKQQLYFYKLLIEGSHTYAGYKVNSARLEFIEPTPGGKRVDPLYIDFDSKYEGELREFIGEIWDKIQNLDF